MKLEKSLSGSISGIMQGSIEGDIELISRPPVLEHLEVNENGLYVPPSGVDGFDRVNVYVPKVLQNLNANENGTYYPSSGVDGFDKVVVDVATNTIPLSIRNNGYYTPPSGFVGFSYVNVNTASNILLFEDGVFYPNADIDLRYYEGEIVNDKMVFDSQYSGFYVYNKTFNNNIVLLSYGYNPNESTVNVRVGRCKPNSILPDLQTKATSVSGRLTYTNYALPVGDFIIAQETTNRNDANECCYLNKQGTDTMPIYISKVVACKMATYETFR